MEEEIWKNYVADDRVKGLFLISNYGNVLSTRSNKILKPSNVNGYFCVATKVGGRSGKWVTIKINRMVAQTFLEPPSQELIDICSKQSHGKVLVLHNDSNKQNNYYKNLRWGSSKDNTQDFDE